MSEVEVTLRTSLPRTRQSLVSDLLNTLLTPGMTVLVHSSLSSDSYDQAKLWLLEDEYERVEGRLTDKMVA
ncbi:MAG: hypothetical protein PUP91_12105 [Rhizonema sp. PD37]|nr:hypothetical protein [Rhizonema sp. PD37]